MLFFKKNFIGLLFVHLAFLPGIIFSQSAGETRKIIHPLTFKQVRIDDPFWSRKLKVWDTKTVYDVFDKLEGNYVPDRPDIIAEKEKLGRTRNALSLLLKFFFNCSSSLRTASSFAVRPVMVACCCLYNFPSSCVAEIFSVVSPS